MFCRYVRKAIGPRSTRNPEFQTVRNCLPTYLMYILKKNWLLPFKYLIKIWKGCFRLLKTFFYWYKRTGLSCLVHNWIFMQYWQTQQKQDHQSQSPSVSWTLLLTGKAGQWNMEVLCAHIKCRFQSILHQRRIPRKTFSKKMRYMQLS